MAYAAAMTAPTMYLAPGAEEPPGPPRRFPRFEQFFAGKASGVADGARQAVEERVVGKAIEIVVGQPFT